MVTGSARRASRSRGLSVVAAVLQGMATVTMAAVEPSGPGIRAALAPYSPADEDRFAAELRDALARAGEDLDLAACRPCCAAGTPAR